MVDLRLGFDKASIKGDIDLCFSSSKDFRSVPFEFLKVTGSLLHSLEFEGVVTLETLGTKSVKTLQRPRIDFISVMVEGSLRPSTDSVVY